MKVLIVDDHPLVRKGIATTLSFEDNIEEIKEASSIGEAMGIIKSYKPEIAIVDLRLGKEYGLNIVENTKREKLMTKFIILTSSLSKEDFLKAKELNVEGYILKEAFAEDMIYAFRVVSRGKKFFDPEMLKYSDGSEHGELQNLTQREKDVLEELGKGLSNVEIAERLFISEHTVKKHVSNILAKLELNHRTQAALLINNSMNVG